MKNQCYKIMLILAVIVVMTTLAFTQHSSTYEGSDFCKTCHDGAVTQHYASWAMTKHAVAYDSVTFIQQNSACLPCHTTGWDTTESAIEGGFDDFFKTGDEAGIAKMKNVGCESCHTPAEGDHPVVTLAAENCGRCHEGSHHPTYSDWQNSLHAVAKFTSIPGGAFEFIPSNPNCSACHTAEGFLQFIESDDLVPNVEAPGPDGHDLTCAACHNPHKGELRLPAVEICAKCHNPEYNPDSPTPDGSAIHHSTAYMLDGKGGYEYEGYTYNNSAHTPAVTEKCVACHVHMTPFEDPIPANTGHSFEPRGEACVDCHTDFVVTEEQDFDYRGIQTEIESLSTQLHEKLAMATSADSSTDSFLRAQFNYEFVHADGSHGIHNTKYARALLTSAIENFEPSGSAVNGEATHNVTQFALYQNYPNPFNPVTTLSFDLAKAENVEIRIFDNLGRQVAELLNGPRKAGNHKISFNAQDFPSGVYIYQIRAGEFVDAGKMMLIK